MTELRTARDWTLKSVLAISLLTLVACSDIGSSTNTASNTPADSNAQQSDNAELGYRRINSSNENDPLGAQIFELDNGLRVYLTENHEEPRFYAEIAVRAGSKHDPIDGTGLAHYLEHLLFKGNQNLGSLDYALEKPHLDRIVELYEEHHEETDLARRAEIYAQINNEAQLAAQYSVPGELDRLYNNMGGTALNAHTWHEETVYKIGLPANRLQQWAEIESDRFVNPVFRLFHTELETVYEEKNRSLDNKDRLIGTAIDEMLYKVHPYGQQPTIGTVEHLKNPSLVYIQNYYDTYYVPNNMAIFMSGDIDTEETIALISGKFAKWESKPVPQVGPWAEEPLQGAERRTVQYPGEEQVQLAFRTAGNGSEDKEALILLDMILDNRTAGLINLNLNQQQLVAGAGSSPLFLNDAGSQNLYGIPKQDQTLEEVEQLLLDQLEIIKAGEFEDWIILAIINDFKKNEKASLEFNQARVSMMRDSFIQGAEWDYHVAELDRMSELTKQDVVNVANKYFGNDYVAVYRVDGKNEIPEVEKPQIDPVNIDSSQQSEFAARILAMEYDEIEPTFVEADRDYRLIEFADGVQLYYAPNPLNDLFSFSINVEVGTEENEKLNLAAALMDVAGTTSRTNEELQKEWYQMGTDFRFGAGENSSGISISGLDEQFEASLALAMDLIKNPSAEEQTLEQMKGILLKSREDQKSSPPAISRALTLYNRYGEESPMLEALTREEIMASTVDELLQLPAGLLNYKHTLTYTGSMPLEGLVEVLHRQHPIAGELEDTPAFRFRTARNLDETEIYVVDQQTAQAQVRIEFADGQYAEEDSLASSIYTNYFGSGMSSVVFQELREARALAYTAGARYSQGGRLNAENIMLGSIGTQTDKTVDALGAFIDLIDNMPESSERFDTSVESLMNRYRTSKISFREVIGAVRSWERLGISGDPRREHYQALQTTSLDDLLSFQQEHVKNRPKLISIVGDLSIIDEEELGEFGTVKEIQIDDLFID
ncbi:MAG: insulinase family protein [Gammaproteobacteria bacterium]|nr:insulinase family protein [Gammaproteobacteria bacterium]MDG2339197.1 insulinase family protein [Gammaproteobacteria bacterium]